MAQSGQLRAPSPDPPTIYLDKVGLHVLWSLIKNNFANVSHTHTAADITDLEAASFTIYRYTEE